ncbi:MAG: hypothetical protein WDN76_05525 [Alphaproteobacteria bacterium]
MIPTIFGLVTALGGLALMRARLMSMLIFVLAMTLLAGSAAFYVLRSAPLRYHPASFAVIFLALRILFSRQGRFGRVAAALALNGPLAVFALYGVFAAFVMPRLFAGDFDVVPQLGRTLRPNDISRPCRCHSVRRILRRRCI